MSIRLQFIIGFSLCLIVGFSCERNADIQLKASQQSLVVEGTIESGTTPQIILTHSLPFATSYDTSVLQDLFIHHAQITVSNQNSQVTLVEKEIDTIPGVSLYYYVPEENQSFIGIAGTTYQLKIETEQKTLEATTTIPRHGFVLDTIWWEPTSSEDKKDSNKVFLMARIFDPPQEKDYARYFTKRNSEPFFSGRVSVAEDAISNGKFFDLRVPRGVPKTVDIDSEDYGYFYRGDTVTLKFCNIDENTYHYWHTWEYARSNQGNPFSSPTKVEGNIPGALGYWGGYQVQTKKIIIPK